MKSKEVEGFLSTAIEYCRLIDFLNSDNEKDKFLKLQGILSQLYAKAQSLPEVEPVYDGLLDIDFFMPHVDFREQSVYWELFDPYQLEEPTAGNLTDDILDIYSDIKRGLVLYEQGEQAEAVWEWRYHFEIHWGNHAVSALRALHAFNFR